jgi:hypothetical protein
VKCSSSGPGRRIPYTPTLPVNRNLVLREASTLMSQPKEETSSLVRSRPYWSTEVLFNLQRRRSNHSRAISRADFHSNADCRCIHIVVTVLFSRWTQMYAPTPDCPRKPPIPRPLSTVLSLLIHLARAFSECCSHSTGRQSQSKPPKRAKISMSES